MNVISNVYYLPSTAADPEPIKPPTRWSILRARMTRRWWRLRIAVSEIRGVLRRPGRRTLEAEFPGLFEAAARIAERPASRREPARILDFDAARIRLRPAPQA